MSNTVTISPLTRIEGHLAIHTETEETDGSGHRIVRAKCIGEMYRGFETILEGRDPLDAQQITQRICGVCPISHGLASIEAQEMAYGVTPVRNGRLLQNLILAANYMQSHILHFYHLAALDFVDVKAVLKYNGADRTLLALKAWVENAVACKDVFAGAPFLPRYEVDQYVKSDELNWGFLKSYVKALRMRTRAHEMGAVFGAKLPHSTSIVPTGVTQVPTVERVLSYRSRLEDLAEFIDDVYLPDVVAAAKAFPQYWGVGQSYGNFLCYGVFRMEEATGHEMRKFLPAGVIIDGRYQRLDPQEIHEHVGCSHFSSPSGLHPYAGRTEPDPRRGYSWLKAPRYRGMPMEVGPLARVMVGYHAPNATWIREKVDVVLGGLGLPVEKMNSVLGRHLARALEASWIAKQCTLWLDEIEIDQPAARDFRLPERGQGYGLIEAPRGALGHWVVLENYKIKRYQCVVPTTWNCSPRDDQNVPGPVEKALEGTVVEDPQHPVEAGRVVRSFDPCIACAVH